MKKLFFIVFLFFVIFLAGCSLDKITVNIVSGDDVYSFKLEKGHALNDDFVSINIRKNMYVLFYDNNYKSIYNYEELSSDTTLYAKELNGDIKIGEFNTLEEAYNKGYLNLSDIQNIKDKYENNDFKDKIDDKTLNKIKNDYLNILINNSSIRADKSNIDNVSIISFFGIYNGYYVIRISSTYFDYPDVIETFVIDDIEFVYSGPNFIVWKE